jgi:hypothetical protein
MIRTQYPPLTSDERDQMERDARKYQGAYTGTEGTLAAHVIRLLAELQRVERETPSPITGQPAPGHSVAGAGPV